MQSPKISVITPNYNHGRFLPEVVDSALSQGYPNLEIIIVDDGSTDNSPEIIEALTADHPEVRPVFLKRNAGVNRAMNRGTQEATGEFAIYRSANDLHFPGFFEKAARMLVEHPQAGLCCGDLAYFADNTRLFQVEPLGLSLEPAYLAPREFARNIGQNPIHGHTVMARLSEVRAAGGFIPEQEWYADWFLYHLIGFRRGVCYIPEPFAYARLDSNSYGNASPLKKDRQRAVLESILRELKTFNRDVINLFMLSGALGFFESDLVDLVFRDEKMRDPETFLLVQRSLYQWSLRESPSYEDQSIPSVIRRILRSHRDWIIEQAALRPEAVITAFGAGSHTRILLRIWDEMDLPPIGAIIVSSEPDSNSFNDIPVYAIDHFDESRAALLVISSHAFEEAMDAKCQKYLSRTPRLTFWNPDLGTRPKPSLLLGQV